MNRRRDAFTLVEILIVVAIMALLAAAVIPQFTVSVRDAQEASAIFQLHALRSEMELYKAQHNGNPPIVFALLSEKTNSDHTTSGTPLLGPYLHRVPENPLNGQSAVKAISGTPVADTSGAVGWLYDQSTGKLYINDAAFVTE